MATEDEINDVLFKEARSITHQKSGKIIKELAEKSISPKKNNDVLEMCEKWLVASIQRIDNEILDIEKKIEEVINEYPETKILKTFPYMSAVRIAKILSGMGAPVEACRLSSKIDPPFTLKSDPPPKPLFSVSDLSFCNYSR